jgi:hypothetical protein
MERFVSVGNPLQPLPDEPDGLHVVDAVVELGEQIHATGMGWP